MLTQSSKGQEIPRLPNVVTPPNERQGDMFSIPGISGTMIPESSLPMGGGSSSGQDVTPFTQSAGAGSTTAALAAKVPIVRNSASHIPLSKCL